MKRAATRLLLVTFQRSFQMNPKANPTAPVAEASAGGSTILAWLYVGIPLAWGVSQTFIKALALFK